MGFPGAAALGAGGVGGASRPETRRDAIGAGLTAKAEGAEVGTEIAGVRTAKGAGAEVGTEIAGVRTDIARPEGKMDATGGRQESKAKLMSRRLLISFAVLLIAAAVVVTAAVKKYCRLP